MREYEKVQKTSETSILRKVTCDLCKKESEEGEWKHHDDYAFIHSYEVSVEMTRRKLNGLWRGR